MPQIEVKFDIDQNGILNVSAKDLGTGKEHSVRIEQSSGLSDEEITRMRSEAEAHASEDKVRRELAEKRNEAEQMCFQLEKLVKENADKLSDADKKPLETAIAKTREVAKGSDVDQIKSAISELEQASHAVSKALYESSSSNNGGPGASESSPERRMLLTTIRSMLSSKSRILDSSYIDGRHDAVRHAGPLRVVKLAVP